MDKMNFFVSDEIINYSGKKLIKSELNLDDYRRYCALVVFKDRITESGQHEDCIQLYLNLKRIEGNANDILYDLELGRGEYKDCITADVKKIEGKMYCIVTHQCYLESDYYSSLVDYCKRNNYILGVYFHKDNCEQSYLIHI